MSRSLKKGHFVDAYLLEKIEINIYKLTKGEDFEWQ